MIEIKTKVGDAYKLMVEGEARTFDTTGMGGRLKQIGELVYRPDDKQFKPTVAALSGKEVIVDLWGTALHVMMKGVFQLSRDGRHIQIRSPDDESSISLSVEYIDALSLQTQSTIDDPTAFPMSIDIKMRS